MTTEKRRRRIYNQEEIERGLYAVAMASGNLARASRELAETGLNIPSRTLSDWTRDKHRERYEEIKLEAIPEIYARLADEMESLVSYQLDVERKLTKKIDDEIDELPPRELAGALRNVATSRGISLDKTERIRGRPAKEPPPTYENFEELLNRIERLSGGAIKRVPNEAVGGFAAELPGADPPSDDESTGSEP
jgi:hypothetical protein